MNRCDTILCGGGGGGRGNAGSGIGSGAVVVVVVAGDSIRSRNNSDAVEEIAVEFKFDWIFSADCFG